MIDNIKKISELVLDIALGRVYARGLKFDKKYLIVSEIAQQYYCEHKLELMYREGKVETEEMKLGTLIHEEMFRGEKLSTEELIDRILTYRRVVASFPLAIVYKSVPILGVPDAVIFDDGEPIALVELKTTRRWIGKVFTCEYVQAQLYSYMLRVNELAEDMNVIIVKVSRDVELTDNIRKKLLNRAIVLIEKYGGSEITVRGEKYSIHVYESDSAAFRYLDWALGYWLGTRGIYVPIDCKSRCRKCEYRHLCRYVTSQVI
ncbi:MAG: Dna2/Cas4 domain-containing protein [Crenarchaeota archaeon]|nr:Dna2/Cas4 domain-containing protein [Thermoproteota archaeon]